MYVQEQLRGDGLATRELRELEAGEESQVQESAAEASVEGLEHLATAVSGLYAWRRPILSPPTVFTREELRLDVDGDYPQMVASGTAYSGLVNRVHWVAHVTRSVTPLGIVHWKGQIFYKDGAAGLLPHTDVSIRRSLLGVRVTYSGGAPTYSRQYFLKSRAFRAVEFEFDCVTGISLVTSIGTHDHPDRPADLPNETLTIEEVYSRSGFVVTKSNGDSVVPLSGAGGDSLWTDAEMHDAMQSHWSRFANRPQWSLWTFFANRHVTGTGLGGVMFDDIGPQHRQGTALFLNSFISQPPASDPNKPAWVPRMIFWTAVHEMGHAFNLAHAWQKHLGTPWIPLVSEPESRSFMNYPYNVSGGQTSFFSDFAFRFSDQELLFMRHAPERFVKMGDAAWFDHHGFEQADEEEGAALRLELRVNRDTAVFDFLEPVVLELKLTNASEDPVLVEDSILKSLDHFTFVVKRDGNPAQQYQPLARYCHRARPAVLQPGESRYESAFIAAGQGGWLISEPGNYLVQACLNHEGGGVVSNPVRLRVLPATSRDEEVIAQDYFSDDVGRALAFDGTRVLESANDTLLTVAGKLAGSAAAFHANIALGMPLLRPFKLLVRPADDATAAVSRGSLTTEAADGKAMEYLNAALGDGAKGDEAAKSLGHCDYRYYAEQVTDVLEENGEIREAAANQKRLAETLSSRRVKGRKVAEQVLRRIRERLAELEVENDDSRGSSRKGSRR